MRSAISRLRRFSAAVALLIAATACEQDATSPSGVSRVSFGTPVPSSGATIQTTGTPPGAFVDRGSGKLSIPITIEAGRDAGRAALFVYLLTADGYCGQNLPDTPSFTPLERGQRTTVTITGFQVFRLPCEVTGVRAMLHTRSGGLLTPPVPADTIAEATLNVRFTIR